MGKLKNRLHDIDVGADYSEEERAGRRNVFYDVENERLFVNESEGKKWLTFGDIVADLDWGVAYRPDASCPREVWRRVRKLSDIEEARRNISKIFNQEISALEHVSLPTTDLNEEFLERYMDHPATRGIIGERMAKNILLRMSYNNPELPFKVEASNAIEDAELKYDFKVWIPERILGVAVESDDMPRDKFAKNKRKVGIQFTVSSIDANLRKKEGQLKDAREKIDEEKFSRYVKTLAVES